MMAVFHMAFRVDDLDSTKRFYGGVLGCPQGREADTWVDFDFFGNQISAHVGPGESGGLSTRVDGEAVPLAHFGVVIPWPEWESLHRRLAGANVPFLVDPRTRFAGQPGEQGTFFVADPSGNALEFKAFRSADDVFAR